MIAQLCIEFDAISLATLPIIVIAATNRPQDIDSALLRSGIQLIYNYI